MEKINCKLKNCFGIDYFEHEFNFSKTNSIAIYARNGLMKTSFAKTFKKIQENKLNDIKDEIFETKGSIDIKVDDIDIDKEEIFVINSFEDYYESDSIADLLVDEKIKKKISDLLKEKNKLLKRLEKYSGLKVQRTKQGKKHYELEPVIVSDMNLKENSILLNLSELLEYENEIDLSNIKYSVIFDKSAHNKIKDITFQNKIQEFCKASNKIYDSYNFFKSGEFTFPKLKNIAKNLVSDNYFVNGNKLLLNDELIISNADELNNKIYEIEDKIKKVPEFQQIEKLLSDAKGIALRDVIENTPEIVEYLKLENLDVLKKELWASYIKKEEKAFNNLVENFNTLDEELKTLNVDESDWQKSLEIFEERFTVPYEMKIKNLKGAMIGENLPHVEFIFKKNGEQVSLDRSSLESLDVLSRGEKRSLYLLNIIFDIEKLKKSDKEILFIIDDIADSFDYKNKYAIVEYLYEMSKVEKFRMIILSHNFDFYRTVSSRLNIPRKSRFIIKDKKSLKLVEEKYQNQPFRSWKENPDEYTVLALIPFMRNLIEYSRDVSIGGIEDFIDDYTLLTSLLHKKENSSIITFEVLGRIYNQYIGNDISSSFFDSQDIVIEKMFEVVESIDSNRNYLEHKILLSIVCRLKAEEIMIDNIREYDGNIEWIDNKKNRKNGNKDEFLKYVEKQNNMTRVLFDGYKQFASKENIKIINQVNIMTPENIHINSFMYEPIMDMDINELLNLFEKIKELK